MRKGQQSNSATPEESNTAASAVRDERDRTPRLRQKGWMGCSTWNQVESLALQPDGRYVCPAEGCKYPNSRQQKGKTLQDREFSFYQHLQMTKGDGRHPDGTQMGLLDKHWGESQPSFSPTPPATSSSTSSATSSSVRSSRRVSITRETVTYEEEVAERSGW